MSQPFYKTRTLYKKPPTMKKSTLIILLLFPLAALSQNLDKEWREVIKYELDGKLQDASKITDQIYKQARDQKNDVQLVKCFFYQSKFLQVFDENSKQKIVDNIRAEINHAPKTGAALLNYVYALMLQQYLNQNWYAVSQIPPVEKQNAFDIKVWSKEDFEREIEKAYAHSLENKNQIQRISLFDLKDILELSPFTDSRNVSLYEFLMDKATDYYKSKVRPRAYEYQLASLYSPTNEFLALDAKSTTDKNLVETIRLLQEKERYVLEGHTDLDLAHYKRIQYAYTLIQNKILYISSLKKLEAATKSETLKQQIKADRALYYFRSTDKNTGQNYYNDVLLLIDTIFRSKVNPNALADAENIREKILQKKLSFTTKKMCYPNENLRALIAFKNIDSVKISCYRLPVKDNGRLNQHMEGAIGDAFVLDFIKRHQPIKVYKRALPDKKDHFDYTTEILLEKFDVGNYLVFIETPNDQSENKISFAYDYLISTNIQYTLNEDEKNDTFRVLDRKSGKPIENVQVRNDNTTAVTDKSGKVGFAKKIWSANMHTESELYFIKGADTLKTKYNKGIVYQDEKPEPGEFEAKAMVYFDRAIYRPGQKMFFKGIVIQKKDKEKSVVPFLSVKVLIEGPNNETLSEYDVQTNEFGSFTGEFLIPKNALTGEFTLSIEEADDYESDSKYYDKKEDEHSFWDNVDFNDQEFSFQVEEYKRPTFEVKFDEIKEDYTYGDTIKISGNAKTLAGSNLTNAAVSYTVSKGRYYGADSKNSFINTKTATDLNGNFAIVFPVSKDTTGTDSDFLHFSVNVTVTDINGESRTAEKSVVVGKRTLKLNTSVNKVLYTEDKNELKILATTLNDYPVPAKGQVRFYNVEKKEFLMNRLFELPEIQTIPKEKFEQLFPYEPYDQSDYDTMETLVQVIDFDTGKGNSVAFPESKNWNTGSYKVVTSATDSNNNLITKESWFELESRNKKSSKKEFFTFNDHTPPNSEYVELHFYSIVPDLYITALLYDGTIQAGEEGIQLKNGTGVLKVKKSAFRNTASFHFSTFWENQYEQKFYSIPKEYIESKLAIEVVCMRNRIEPGSTENWSFRIKDSKQEAEFLASMYDSSLDQFKTGTWDMIAFKNYNSLDYPDFYNNNNRLYIRFDDLGTTTQFYKEYIRTTQIYWFGFNFVHPNKYENKKYLEKMAPLATIPSNAKKVTGTVSDNSGPLPGANVFVKGTSRGTQTDLDGYFEIEATKDEYLIFSFIGMEDRILKADSNSLKVKLADGGASLSEVVVQGYGTIVKKNAIASSTTVITSVKSNLIEELQSQVPGLYLGLSSGASGTTNILIRGVASLKNNTPLYVIDGVAMADDFSLDLDTNNIQSVTVLKEASATVLYGNRASNGVIIISTKRALQELTQVKARTNFNETAFFFPKMVTDREGKISFSFTCPESLTQWNLRLLAHNKKAEMGYFSTAVISQKDLMVIPNMPRFVREKDVMTISTKVANMTNETKSGIAMLMLYDAASGKAIDSLTMNQPNTRNFQCKPKESIVLDWRISIPENLQGLLYKIVAKSSDFSDGEENILPVLSNKILLTESIPLWVKGNTKKEYTFENFKNNTSTTLQHYSMTLEYTSNPVWLAIESLPYLMEFEHECAEQTFARYYANCIAAEIINSNPKVAGLFDSWRKQGSTKSRLDLNDELKSVVLAETPWLLDAQSEEEKNKRMAVLFDLATLKDSSDRTLKKLEDKLLPSGGFPWFDGGVENSFISQHILSGIGHLQKLFPASAGKYDRIVSKGIPNLDNRFIASFTSKNKPSRMNYTDLHYLYARSFYLNTYPLSPKTDSIVAFQIKILKKNWLEYSLYEKGILALVMQRYKEKEFASKIITHLKQTSANNTENGMYWLENTNSCYWYQSPIETQALLIEAFSEIENDRKSTDAMKVWLIKNKQSKNWPTTKATTEAIYALLLQGSDWISVKDNTKIKIGDEKILTKKLSEKEKEAHTGYLKLNWKANEMDSKMYSISIDNKSEVPGFGGVYWQYFENLENIKTDSTATLSISKEVYKKNKGTGGEKLIQITNDKIKVGDLLTIRLIVRSKSELEFVHIKDLRASCFEPVDVISGYNWVNNAGYYRSTKDVATHFFFDNLPKGTYVMEYDVLVNNSGNFNDGIATIQSMYAPEFSAHSDAVKIVSE